MLPRGWLLFLISLAVLAATLLFCLRARGAPAPFARRCKPRPLGAADVVGIWQGKWGGVDAVMTFRPDGTYHEWYQSTVYTGYWGIEKGRLMISEKATEENCQRPLVHFAVAGMTPDSLCGLIGRVGADEKCGFSLDRRLD